MSNTSFAVHKEELKVVMERVFDAPRDLVFRAFADSKLIPQWWGPRKITTRVEKNDVRVGGVWRFICHAPDGREDTFHGVYLRIEPPGLISHTFNYEPIGPGHELTETAEFEEISEGKTRVTITSVYNTIEDLEGMVGAGMEAGASESYDRLAELLVSLKQSVGRLK
jgi:uncharacterized protein YndB with AHSA1/START domain